MDIYWLFDFMNILKNIDKEKIDKIHRNMIKNSKKKKRKIKHAIYRTNIKFVFITKLENTY